MKLLKLTAILVLTALLASCGAEVADSGGAEVALFAASVGKGDALIVKVDGYACLIDAGKAYARGKVRSAMAAMGVDALDAVFVTHLDDDHTGGLEWLAQSDIPVGTWYASAMYTGVKEKKHAAVIAAAERGQAVRWLKRGDAVPLGDTGAVFDVLAPSRQYDDKDDNNSLVLRLRTGQGRMLLAGDMEFPEEGVLLSQGDDLSCAVLKVPNHGDDDACSDALIRAVAPQVAVISTDGMEKPGTPDPGVVRGLTAVGAQVCVTQDAALGVKVTLRDGAASAEYVGIDAPAVEGIYIESVVPGEDTVTLRNTGSDMDMTGCYLYSDRGGELFAFPDGWVLPGGSAATVGSLSSDGDYDLLWEDKKVIHKSKADSVALYDRWGRCVDIMSNGM